MFGASLEKFNVGILFCFLDRNLFTGALFGRANCVFSYVFGVIWDFKIHIGDNKSFARKVAILLTYIYVGAGFYLFYNP